MLTKVKKVTIEDVSNNPEILREPANLLKEGELVVFPTETVYGLGANALNDEAVLKVFEIKGRPSDNPLIVHLHSKDVIEKYAYISNEVESQIIETLTPGPITVILKKREIISNYATAGLETVGIRIPYHPVAQKLIETANVPIAAPSANLSGKPSPSDTQSVIEDLSGKVPYIIDSGRTHIGIESTVISVKRIEGKYLVTILRPGFITKEDIEEIFKHKKMQEVVEVIYKEEIEGKPLSPGLKYKHYAPRAHVIIVSSISKEFDNLAAQFKNQKCGILGRPKFIKKLKQRLEILNFKSEKIIPLEWCKDDIIECARNLFFAYRYFDRENVDAIFVEKLSENGVEYAIMNRVKKSATYFI
jgi:L-threonylcarbamoyladenylate synthase